MNDEEQQPATPAPEGEPQESHEKERDPPTHEHLEEALREKDQFRLIAQRAQADLINYKRRSAEEMDELRRAANSRLLTRVLSVVDDLDRALSHIPEDAVTPGWFDGLLLVQRNLNNLLESESVTKIEALGQPFGPWEFEAVQYEETTEVEDGHVTRVVREGYRLRDRVLRAAQVIVAKRPEPEQQSETTEEGE